MSGSGVLLPRKDAYAALPPPADPSGSRGSHLAGGIADSARVSVIVPLRPGSPVPRSIEIIEREQRPDLPIEVILSEGECPSRQRNLAARIAGGDLLLFLDDDSEPAKDLLHKYAEVLLRTDAAAVGGPALYRARTYRERLAAAVLAEVLVTGLSASRYSARGIPRPSDERELILSNLAVRRAAFESVGGFEETLYPNEENFFLDRLRSRGEKVLYDPTLIVTRPALLGWKELIEKVFRYGGGRAAQMRRQLSIGSALRGGAALLALSSSLATLAALPWTVLPLLVQSALLTSYYGVIGLRVSLRHGIKVGAGAPFTAFGVHTAYAVGLCSGLFRRRSARLGPVRIERRALRDSSADPHHS